tara:strand:- start:451 stop:570 length:120 start_codon:yes stop_codon:yes gene_type:complete
MADEERRADAANRLFLIAFLATETASPTAAETFHCFGEG